MIAADEGGNAAAPLPQTTTAVKVSVVVPVRNEETSLPALLDSLLHQTHRAEEILVVDGGSTDATLAVAAEYADRGVVVTSIGPAYPGRGRNEGAARARNEWIAFIDAGCRADPGWLAALVGETRPPGPSPDAVFGSYRVELLTEWERAQALTYVPPEDRQTRCRPPFIASALLKRSAFEAAGRFSESLRAAEDLLFFEQLARAGAKVVRSAKAEVVWKLPPGPAAAARRFRLYSAHHLAAGLFRTWHLRVMAMNGVGLALLASAFWTPIAFPLVAAAFAARLLSTTWTRRGNIAPAYAFRPDRLARVSVLLVLADLAMWAGALDYVRARRGGGWSPRP